MDKLEHTCRGTCSGWDDGFEGGCIDMEKNEIKELKSHIIKLRRALEEVLVHDPPKCDSCAKIVKEALENNK